MAGAAPAINGGFICPLYPKSPPPSPPEIPAYPQRADATGAGGRACAGLWCSARTVRITAADALYPRFYLQSLNAAHMLAVASDKG